MEEQNKKPWNKSVIIISIIFLLFTTYISINIATTNSPSLSLSDAGLEFLDNEKDPFKDKKYYYNTAEKYVTENYEAPEKKNIKALEKYLNQIKLRPYKDNSVFTCTEISAMVEWLLEGAGFQTKIVLNYDLSTKTIQIKRKHAWILVNTTTGSVAVEPKKLTKNNYKPPGIITKPNGKFKEYSAYYQTYEDWKQKMNKNISFKEWKKTIYMNQNTWTPKYYSPKEIKETPHSYIKGDTRNGTKYKIPKEQFDWYNIKPYSNTTAEFSNWT